jgi:hypothetical protein
LPTSSLRNSPGKAALSMQDTLPACKDFLGSDVCFYPYRHGIVRVYSMLSVISRAIAKKDSILHYPFKLLCQIAVHLLFCKMLFIILFVVKRP